MTPALDAVRREELKKKAETAHVHGWRCPFCNCQTFARCDELEQHGYAPGDDVRCVSCKHEFYWPRYNETADTTLALLAYIAELEADALDRTDIAARAIYDSGPSIGDDTEDGWEKQSEQYKFRCHAIAHIVISAALLPKASVREERG